MLQVRIKSLIGIGIFYKEKELFSKHSQLGSEASHLDNNEGKFTLSVI